MTHLKQYEKQLKIVVELHYQRRCSWKKTRFLYQIGFQRICLFKMRFLTQQIKDKISFE